jgi:hypothetical protein
VIVDAGQPALHHAIGAKFAFFIPKGLVPVAAIGLRLFQRSSA